MSRTSNFGFRVPASRGSALILTVVLTSLLAIVGVLFLMATRIDKMASSATSEGRELANAVDTVLAQINEDLVEDVPGVTGSQEYYDYPDAANAWLADLEPNAVQIDPNTFRYCWRQISNIRGVIPPGPNDVNVRDVNITTIGERQPVPVDRDTGEIDDVNNYADADGDGVSDAKWFVLPGEMSSRGRPIYAAVRIVDNGGMLNVNTGYAFDPCSMDTSRVDGSTPLQVNVLTLAHAPGGAPTVADARELRRCRANYASNPPESDLAAYEREVIWRYLDTPLRLDPNYPTFTPFDTSDELELRYRFFLDHLAAKNTRLEVWGAFGGNTALSVPREYPAEVRDDWYPRVAADGLPGTAAALDSRYAYRHAVTTYNMDRLITPALPGQPRRMLNVNLVSDEDELRNVIRAVLSQAMGRDMGVEATQITVNLLDYIDDDDRVTIMPGSVSASPFYGFERPCVYISEVACRWGLDRGGMEHKSYAIELFKPYFEDLDPQAPPVDQWRLTISGGGDPERVYEPFAWGGHGTRRFQVLLTDDPATPLGSTITFKPDESDDGEPVDPLPVHGYRRTDYDNQPQILPDNNKLLFGPNDVIYLERRVAADDWQKVDRSVPLPASLFVPDSQPRSIQRNIADDMCVWRQWTPTVVEPNLGLKPPQKVMNDPNMFPALPPLQAHPANKGLTNIGELGKIFLRNVYLLSSDMAMSDIMVDLTNPAYAELFNYLTVINPTRYQGAADPNQQTVFDPAETRVMGRININTAPSFVLAQLPWMRYTANGSADAVALQRARAIVKRRNGGVPYKSIGELMQLEDMRSLDSDGASDLHTDPTPGPDLTPDNAMDDFEERDLLFTRISNLVTVRSDVFTAYILVRIGENGPQRRVVAILDRSRVSKLGDRVRIVAEQLVPDPR